MDTGLPQGWEVRHSNSKNLPYYFNPATKESRWEPPSGADPEKLKLYMAHYHSSSAPSQLSANQSGGGAGGNSGKIRCAHLLIKHRDSRRPASWREERITRSKEEAREIIEAHQARIAKGEVTLSELAVSESDCSSARKGGDLGFFSRGDMQREFEDAAFALSPGNISQVVDTASGLHLIQRIE